jgi:hypothetical protein
MFFPSQVDKTRSGWYGYRAERPGDTHAGCNTEGEELRCSQAVGGNF